MGRSLIISVASGVLSGVIEGIWLAQWYGSRAGMAGGLFTGVTAGAVLFFITGILHDRAMRKSARDVSETAGGIHHIREIEIERSFDESFDVCIESINVIRRCRLKKKDRSAGMVVAKAGINWKTWGDTITIDVCSTGERTSRIRVSSKPTHVSTIVDFGRNLQNIKSILSFLADRGGIVKARRSANG